MAQLLGLLNKVRNFFENVCFDGPTRSDCSNCKSSVVKCVDEQFSEI